MILTQQKQERGRDCIDKESKEYTTSKEYQYIMTKYRQRFIKYVYKPRKFLYGILILPFMPQ